MTLFFLFFLAFFLSESFFFTKHTHTQNVDKNGSLSRVLFLDEQRSFQGNPVEVVGFERARHLFFHKGSIFVGQFGDVPNKVHIVPRAVFGVDVVVKVGVFLNDRLCQATHKAIFVQELRAQALFFDQVCEGL